MALIDKISFDLLKSPELTGQWEHKLRMIERGTYEAQTFKEELFVMVRELTDQVIFNN
jgi:DNA topoisomerase-3